MSAMEQLYQQLILDHAKSGHGKGLAQDYSAESFQVNPTCGDQVRLRVRLADDGSTVDQISWDGHGCSISQASVSLMTELTEHKPVAEVAELSEAFGDLMHSRGEGIDEEREDMLGDAIALSGVAQYPARIKCALLGWMALRDAMTTAQAEAAHKETS